MKLASKTENELTEEHRNDINEYNRASQRLENCRRLNVPQSFKEDLDIQLEAIGAYKEDRQTGGVVSKDIQKAEFEADYMMAYHVWNGTSTCIYLTDGDMNVLCRPTSICIRDFSEEKGKNKRKKNDDGIDSPVLVYEISGISNALVDEIKEKIDTKSPANQIVYTKAKYPILEKAIPPYLTSLYVVGMGCDVLPGGVTGITPLSISRELKRLEEEEAVSSYEDLYEKMIAFYIKKDTTKRLGKKDLHTYCQAFMYQPALRMGSKSDHENWNYVFGKPSLLHPYLRMFVHPDSGVQIEDEQLIGGGRLGHCKGIDTINASHNFLLSEGSFTCTSCEACFCNTCGYSKKRIKETRGQGRYIMRQ